MVAINILISVVVISIIVAKVSIIATKTTTMEIVEILPIISSDRYEYTIFIIYDEDGNKW